MKIVTLFFSHAIILFGFGHKQLYVSLFVLLKAQYKSASINFQNTTFRYALNLVSVRRRRLFNFINLKVLHIFAQLNHNIFKQ